MSPRTYAAISYVPVFVAIGAAAPYLPVYYQSLGLSLDAIGLLAAVAALSGLAAAPAWGLLADRLAGSRLVLPASCLAAAACATGLALVSQPAIVALVAVLQALAFAGVTPVLDARALETVADDQHRYGRLRVWGSASFVVSSVAVGWLIEHSEIRSLFIVFVGALVLTAAVGLGLRSSAAVLVLPRLTGLQAVFRSRPLVAFLASGLIAWSASTAINGFLSIYLVDIAAPETLVGLSWAIGAIVEIPLMIAFPALARRAGLERLLLLGAALLLLRAIAIVVLRDPVLAMLTTAIHGAGFALLLVGGVTYVARHAPRGAAATAQGVLSGVVFGLAHAIGPGLGGALARPLGLPTMFVVAAGASAVALLVLAWAIRLETGADPRTVRGASA